MGQYGEAAINAAHRLIGDNAPEPLQAWNQAIQEMGKPKLTRCGKGAFLGLCYAGYIANCEHRPNNINVNGQYAIDAIDWIHNNNENFLQLRQINVWRGIGNEGKAINGQMDVVFSLLRENLINLF